MTALSIGSMSCTAAPLDRPMNTGPVASGPGTVENARRFLEGRWTLVSLTIRNAAGKQATVEATGFLVNDEFGNLEIEYQISEPGLKTMASVGVASPNPVISTKGRVVISTQNRTITYMSPGAGTTIDPEREARRANPFALERIRYYSLGDDGVLTFATRHDDGSDAAVSRWRKAQ